MSHLKTNIQWKDLRSLSKYQIIYNVILPYPFLLVSFYFMSNTLYFFALIFSVLFFTASFRQAHDCFHGTLGLKKKATRRLLFISSILILSSNHSTRSTHLAHHRAPLSDSDLEAKSAHLKWYQAIINGVPFWFELQKHGYEIAHKKDRPYVLCEFACILAVIVIAITSKNLPMIFHYSVMFIGNSLVGFVAGWCVHHDCHDDVIARTERNWVANLLTFNLLFHMEHHLYPAVPSNNLPKLAERLDAVTSPSEIKSVIPKFKWKEHKH